MKKQTNARHWAKGLFVLFAGLSVTACVDDSYDMSKDLDMTMALGGEGLQMKLGTTEKILLGDLLEVDKEEMFGEDANGLFYLTMKESTNFRFDVKPVTAKINQATLSPEVEVINLGQWQGVGVSQLPVPANLTFDFPGVLAYDKFDLNISGIDDDVQKIKSITPAARTNRFNLKLDIVQKGSDFRFKDIKDLTIVFPAFVKCTAAPGAKYKLETNEQGETVITFPDGSIGGVGTSSIELGTVDLQCIQLGDAGNPDDKGLAVSEENGERVLHYEDDITMTGDFVLGAAKAFTMKAANGDFTDIRLTVTLAGHTPVDGKIPVDIDRVQGVFNPEIAEPVINPITLGDDLPDFLRDPDVKINVANPTLKFKVDMREIPMSIQFKGELQGDGYPAGMGTVPGAVVVRDRGGFVTLNKEREQYIYFCDHGTPYDPEGMPAEHHDIAIDGLADMVSVLPERINVDINPVQVLDDELNTIRLGETYDAYVDYDVLFPFEVNAGMKIVYNDSITGMHEDMQDYEADGIIITADVDNTIPMELNAGITAVDYMGQEMDDVTVTTARIERSEDGQTVKTSGIELRLTFKNRADLRRLDLLRFKIDAGVPHDVAGTSSFTSKQYLQVRNLRLKLAGPIVGDFN